VVTSSELTPHLESYRHKYHWETEEEVEITAAGASGEQSLGEAAPQADTYIRVRELTVRNSGNVDTVVQLLAKQDSTYHVKLSIDVPSGTTRMWESGQGRKFSYGQQPVVRASPVGGTIYVSGSGVIASVVDV